MQTAVNATMDAALPGQLIFPLRPTDKVSRVAESTDFPPGVFVTQGTADTQTKAPTTAAGITGTGLEGIALLNLAREPGSFTAGDEVTVCKQGTVAVVAAAGSYTKNGAVNVRYDGTGTKGSITAAAVTDETGVCSYAKIAETKTLSAAGVIQVQIFRL